MKQKKNKECLAPAQVRFGEALSNGISIELGPVRRVVSSSKQQPLQAQLHTEPRLIVGRLHIINL